MRRLLTTAKRLDAWAHAHRRAVLAVLALALLAGSSAFWWLFLAPRGRGSFPAGTPRTIQPALRPTSPVRFEDGCITAACHTTLRMGPFTHAPIRDQACDACHARDAGNHTFPLRAAKPALCAPCHETSAHQPVQHGAMTDDGCLACHQPHRSDTRALLTRATVPDTCTACHRRSDAPVPHAPYAADRCDLCHAPHGSQTRELLAAGTVTETCRACHPAVVARVEESRHSHAKAEGGCLACHNAHAGQARGLLPGPPRETCTRCHADIGTDVASAKVPHDPIVKGDQCTRCHDPHASDHQGMLRTDQASLCLTCHDKPIPSAPAAGGRKIASMAHLATPHRQGVPGHRECSGCHSVHGSTHDRLLKNTATAVPLGPFDRRNYALCFSCHDPRLATAAAATLFRDGDRNLHAVHLEPGDRSRGCSACHSVHAEGEPRLIAKTANFEGSGWALPLGFSLTTDGGRCGAGCHEAQEYSRRPGGFRQGGAP